MKNKLAAIFTPRVVEEPAELAAGQIILHVAWIEVIKYIEDAEPSR